MRRTHRGRILPKISTMPRQATEAAAYLDIYKLVIEKKRLQQELEGIDERRHQIGDRLAQLETQIAQLEQAAHQARDADPVHSSPALPPTDTPPPFDTLFLDY
jgi:septal ring factor EnvC (AmiA/AmiB activator)